VYTVSDSQAKTAAHAVLAAVLQVRDARLQVLLWQRAKEPYAGAWALPGGSLAEDETLEESARRHLAEKVDVRDLSHLEQLETLSEPNRNPAWRELATAYLGLIPAGIDPQIAPPTFTLAELRDIYAAALGHHVTATNLQRVLLRRQLIEETGERRHYGSGGGRPAAIYRFGKPQLEITDQFAVLRPPTMGG
jgi:8-oxo-dGTP diphosphatase